MAAGSGTRTPSSPSGSCAIRPKDWQPGNRRTSGASRSPVRPICARPPRPRGPRSLRSRGPRGRLPTLLPRPRNPRTGPPPSRPGR
jgi:hypothetical protein